MCVALVLPSAVRGEADSETQVLEHLRHLKASASNGSVKVSTSNEGNQANLRVRTYDKSGAIKAQAEADLFAEFLVEGGMSIETPNPTKSPTKSPTPGPTKSPTPAPTPSPTMKAATPAPTKNPSSSPTVAPTSAPTPLPSNSPTVKATPSPTVGITPSPTQSPSQSPTAATPSPTVTASAAPTTGTPSPTANPTPVPTGLPSSRPTESPTATPSVEPSSRPTQTCNLSEEGRTALISSFLRVISDPVEIDDPLSPQHFAFDWIISQDAAMLCPQDPNLIQRYVLAVFYYSTRGDRWSQCSSPVAYDDEDAVQEANLACNIRTSGGDSDAWLSPSSECKWGGLACDDEGRLIKIDMGE